jgi:hypothetical protein
MKTKIFPGIAALLFLSFTSNAAANLFFFKIYSEDFKKKNTNIFFGGDPIYGLINVSGITVNDDNVTSVEAFANDRGGVLITLYFPDLNEQMAWRMPLASGRVKNNRFLFCLMPEAKEKLDDDYFRVLKLLNAQKGSKVNVTVMVGDKNITAWRQENIVIDLTNGLGVYADWYNQHAPASIKSNNIYYPVCISATKPDADLRREELRVLSLTADGMKVLFGEVESIVDKVEGYDFMRYESTINPSFYAKQIDDQSFVFYQPWKKAYSVYHIDKSKTSEADMNKRCATDVIQTLDENIGKYLDAERKKKYDSEKGQRVALSNHMRALKSQRNDPEMEKKITQWWNVNNPEFPAQKVFFLDKDFFLVRDEYNQVLRKLISAVVLYKAKNGICSIQWNAFGFEHLGGGAFDNQLTVWKAGYKQYGNYVYKIPNADLYAAYNYELDTCN